MQRIPLPAPTPQMHSRSLQPNLNVPVSNTKKRASSARTPQRPRRTPTLSFSGRDDWVDPDAVTDDEDWESDEPPSKSMAVAYGRKSPGRPKGRPNKAPPRVKSPPLQPDVKPRHDKHHEHHHREKSHSKKQLYNDSPRSSQAVAFSMPPPPKIMTGRRSTLSTTEQGVKWRKCNVPGCSMHSLFADRCYSLPYRTELYGARLWVWNCWLAAVEELFCFPHRTYNTAKSLLLCRLHFNPEVLALEKDPKLRKAVPEGTYTSPPHAEFVPLGVPAFLAIRMQQQFARVGRLTMQSVPTHGGSYESTLVLRRMQSSKRVALLHPRTGALVTDPGEHVPVSAYNVLYMPRDVLIIAGLTKRFVEVTPISRRFCFIPHALPTTDPRKLCSFEPYEVKLDVFPDKCYLCGAHESVKSLVPIPSSETDPRTRHRWLNTLGLERLNVRFDPQTLDRIAICSEHFGPSQLVAVPDEDSVPISALRLTRPPRPDAVPDTALVPEEWIKFRVRALRAEVEQIRRENEERVRQTNLDLPNILLALQAAPASKGASVKKETASASGSSSASASSSESDSESDSESGSGSSSVDSSCSSDSDSGSGSEQSQTESQSTTASSGNPAPPKQVNHSDAASADNANAKAEGTSDVKEPEGSSEKAPTGDAEPHSVKEASAMNLKDVCKPSLPILAALPIHLPRISLASCASTPPAVAAAPAPGPNQEAVPPVALHTPSPSEVSSAEVLVKSEPRSSLAESSASQSAAPPAPQTDLELLKRFVPLPALPNGDVAKSAKGSGNGRLPFSLGGLTSAEWFDILRSLPRFVVQRPSDRVKLRQIFAGSAVDELDFSVEEELEYAERPLEVPLDDPMPSDDDEQQQQQPPAAEAEEFPLADATLGYDDTKDLLFSPEDVAPEPLSESLLVPALPAPSRKALKSNGASKAACKSASGSTPSKKKKKKKSSKSSKGASNKHKSSKTKGTSKSKSKSKSKGKSKKQSKAAAKAKAKKASAAAVEARRARRTPVPAAAQLALDTEAPAVNGSQAPETNELKHSPTAVFSPLPIATPAPPVEVTIKPSTLSFRSALARQLMIKNARQGQSSINSSPLVKTEPEPFATNGDNGTQ